MGGGGEGGGWGGGRGAANVVNAAGTSTNNFRATYSRNLYETLCRTHYWGY